MRTQRHRAVENPNTDIIDVVVVTAPGCHYCERVDDLLRTAAQRYPLTVRRVELASEEGMKIARTHRVPFPPILLIDGQYFGHGRLSERKLERALAQRIEAEG